MSIVKQLILDADDELRYPSLSEIHKLQNFCHSGANRIRIARILADNETRLVQRGSRRFWKKCPVTPSNSGNLRKTNSCQRDQGWYIRLIAYCVLAGNNEPLTDIGVVGMREMYQSLGIPLGNWVEALRCLKEEALVLLNQEDAEEVIPYFDCIIQALATPGAPYRVNNGSVEY
ncbi:MAG: allophycocyanin subunit alpha-B [Cyanobacteria bacterium P01_G01_bin.67]